MIETLVTIISEKEALSGADKEKLLNLLLDNRTRLTKAAVKSKLVSEHSVLTALAGVYNIDYSPAISIPPKKEWTRQVSKSFLKKYCLVPAHKKNAFAIAVNDPSDLSPPDDLMHILKKKDYKLILSPKQEILSAINAFYDHSEDQARQLVENMEDNELTSFEDIGEIEDLLDDTSDAPVIRLVNHMISQAVKASASDIHVEPFHDQVIIRYRIDGLLYETLHPPKGVQSALISRIKVMAGMNIAEKRVPQDGRAQVRIGDQEIDLRISTVPTEFGERLVMRLLNKSGSLLSLSEFGMPRARLSHLKTIIRQTHGIVLVTGPTGSGKTTTLYAGLSEINSPDKNIITIEDPIEYNIERIGQIQVNPKTGVTFAKGLKSIVRQDPDVILIGEIRDIETATIAIQSALTGHLVFSTLHTNDAPGAVTRLVDLGIEPYLICSSVNTIIAQRLVRVLCTNCREKNQLKYEDVKSLGETGEQLVGTTVYKAGGCSACFNTGYSGRQAIFEIIDLDDELKNIILATSDSNVIRDAAIKKGMQTLRQDGLEKVRQGITTIAEVLRVTQN